LFPKLKMKLKGWHFETLTDIRSELQVVLDSIKENDFHVLLKRAKNYGIAVHVPKETILKEMAAKIRLNQHFFFDLVQELSDTPRTHKFQHKGPEF
jgi:hypothetical protein